MRRGRSTTTPTKEEAAWLVAVKQGPCLACLIFTGERRHGCDAHHLLSGGRRIGHLATIGLCAWHHRGMIYEPNPRGFQRMRDALGPSLMDGSKPFRAAYGTDAELLALQKQVLGVQ